MAQEMYEEEKTSYSGFERFLFIVTPILFTVILLGVLLTLFNVNWRNSVMDFASNIPVVNKLLPGSEEKEVAGGTDEKEETQDEPEPSSQEQIDDLKKLLASKDEDLRVLAEKRKELDEEVKDLKTQLNDSMAQNKEQEKDDYDKQIKSIANMYGKMMPNKAAPIMEKWETAEIALVLQAMKPDQRSKLLEKMDPQIAADVSIMLKEAKTSDNLKIAALQAQLKKKPTPTKSEATSHTGLDKTELSNTFANMSPESGAEVLLETAKSNPQKALSVLNTVDDATRSKLLDAMTQIDKVATAKLVEKIVPNT